MEQLFEYNGKIGKLISTGEGELFLGPMLRDLISNHWRHGIFANIPDDKKKVLSCKISSPAILTLEVMRNPPSRFLGYTEEHLMSSRLIADTVGIFLDGRIKPSNDPIVIRGPRIDDLESRARLISGKYYCSNDAKERMYADLHDEQYKERRNKRPRESDVQHTEPTGTQKNGIIPAQSSFSDACNLIVPFLPPNLARDPQFICYAAGRALRGGMSADEFDEWAEKKSNEMREDKKVELEDKKVELEMRTIERTTIIETDVRCEVSCVFSDTFDAPCGFKCGSNISVDCFYMLRRGDEFTLCCANCSEKKGDHADGRAKRVKDENKSLAWQRYHGKAVRAPCFICGGRQPSMHFYLDEWHAGHDVPRKKRGSNKPENLAPIHPGCNRRQGQMTFNEYMGKVN